MGHDFWEAIELTYWIFKTNYPKIPDFPGPGRFQKCALNVLLTSSMFCSSMACQKSWNPALGLSYNNNKIAFIRSWFLIRKKTTWIIWNLIFLWNTFTKYQLTLLWTVVKIEINYVLFCFIIGETLLLWHNIWTRFVWSSPIKS